MSNLSRQECEAGISRLALATFRKAQEREEKERMRGQFKTTHIDASNGNGASGDPPKFSRTETFTELSTTKMTSIVCTPYRTVEILETADGMFAIRETAWQGSNAHVSHIWLKPYEVTALKDALHRIEVVEAGRA